ncbi:MAG: hypothetical protein AAF432_11145 [Planctomycetota bacterium]
MRIELRDMSRRKIGRIDLDSTLRPTRVTVVGSEREVYLDWEAAMDDSDRLRRCLACGGTDLYRDKVFPAATAIVVVLAFVGAAIGVSGLATNPLVFSALIAILVIDVALLLFSKVRLVCYRCGSSFHGIRIAEYHRGWDRATAERYPRPRRTAKDDDNAATTMPTRGTEEEVTT